MILIVVNWLLVIGWASLIFWLSSIPSLSSGLGIWDFILRKIAHLVEFGVLTALLIRAAIPTWPQFHVRKIISCCMVLAILYAISDEVHQGFVPGRGPSALDVCIDAVGVILAGVFYWKKK